ncbi:hypothetical protein D3Z45_00285 [Lachnospiraceae bacterium]|nr:hypothetical protein [Lachnospiraceae bacterium]
MACRVEPLPEINFHKLFIVFLHYFPPYSLTPIHGKAIINVKHIFQYKGNVEEPCYGHAG